jgi:zinc transporter ZupT
MRKWEAEQLHLFVAFGAGVFLGTVFLHLLPEVVHEGPADLASTMVLLGFMFLLLFERTLVGHHAHHCGEDCPHHHEILGLTSFVGLSVHSLAAGFSLGVAVLNPELGSVIFFSIMAHKATAAFSLSTVFVLADMERWKSMLFLAAFSLMTPVGAWAAVPLIERLEEINLAIPTALAAGTFLYVATMELVPEAFHEAEEGRRLLPFAFITLGVIVMYVIGRLGV